MKEVNDMEEDLKIVKKIMRRLWKERLAEF